MRLLTATLACILVFHLSGYVPALVIAALDLGGWRLPAASADGSLWRAGTSLLVASGIFFGIGRWRENAISRTRRTLAHRARA